jgi:hypothetical protein
MEARPGRVPAPLALRQLRERRAQRLGGAGKSVQRRGREAVRDRAFDEAGGDEVLERECQGPLATFYDPDENPWMLAQALQEAAE